ncbi:MAG: tyrosine-type recombinase/integrase [Rhodoferax sp.]|nr:tyrosine-type recombinase/integrase [Rhodoferax sp.]
MNKSAMLGPWVRRFLIEHLVAERNLAINTQKSYRDMLILLLPYLASKVDKRIDRLTVDDLSPQMVRLFLTHMEDQRHCAVSTRNQRLGGIHALARFIGEHAPEYVDWWAQIHLIPIKKTSQPQISYLNKPEMDALLAASDLLTAQGRREHALLLFMFNSGARASEAAQLRIGDVDWHTRSVSIAGKGNKQRRCPLWQSTLDELHSQTEGRAAPAPVFLNRFGQTMTRSGIHALVKRCAVRARTVMPSLAGKNVHPHVIRHTTASLLLQAGVDINTIRGWLGHVSLTTTNIYAEINLETKARALAACEVESDTGGQKHWRDQPDLMAFLRTL